MKAVEIQEHLRALNGGWLNPEDTVDTFKAGSPDVEVSGIAVGWMSYTWALEKATQLGCNVFITHEPTYYGHDASPEMFRPAEVAEKRKFIEENGLVVIRCHDLWDQMPKVGIPASWGEVLALGREIAGSGYYRVYDVSGKTALEIARQVASSTADFGQQAVQLIGPGDAPVTRAVIGTGAITPFVRLIDEYQADLVICTDDGFSYCRDGGYAIDIGVSAIVVNHTVSEEAGLVNLAHHLSDRFPGVPVHHIPQRCVYQLVRPA